MVAIAGFHLFGIEVAHSLDSGSSLRLANAAAIWLMPAPRPMRLLGPHAGFAPNLLFLKSVDDSFCLR
jgi:hypothetical protein